MTDPLVKALVGDSLREPLESFEEAWASWSKSIGMMRDRAKKPPKAKAGKRSRIVVVPDVHAPFHEEAMLAEVIAREEGRADHCICIGDVSDAYAFSTYNKYARVPFSEEWASVTAVMQALSEAFPRVDVVIGNHDMRLEKRIRERISEDAVDAVRWMTGGTLCPLTALTRRYKNVHVADHRLPNGESVDWCMKVGDAWLGHPEKWSKVPGAALRVVEEWLCDHEVDFNMGRPRLIVLGHTHTYSQFYWKAGAMLIECGTLAKTQGYMLNPKIGGRPQRHGYVTFEQVAGVTDLNSVKFHSFG
jgi:predicted phosphodiesterase